MLIQSATSGTTCPRPNKAPCGAFLKYWRHNYFENAERGRKEEALLGSYVGRYFNTGSNRKV
eukprot:1075170-Rhodomonas_salina.1